MECENYAKSEKCYHLLNAEAGGLSPFSQTIFFTKRNLRYGNNFGNNFYKII